MSTPRLVSKEEWDKFHDAFWQDYRRSQWHSRYSEPSEAMYAVIAKHGGHVMWPKYSDMKHNVFYAGPLAGTWAVHVYKGRMIDGGIYPSLKVAKLAAWDMRRLFPEDETDLAIQVIGEGRKQYLFIGGFTNKMQKFVFQTVERDRKATPQQRQADQKARYQPWTKGKRK